MSLRLSMKNLERRLDVVGKKHHSQSEPSRDRFPAGVL